MSYEESIKQLESIVHKMESGEYSIDELATQIEKARKLITVCKERLTKTEADINKILEQ